MRFRRLSHSSHCGIRRYSKGRRGPHTSAPLIRKGPLKIGDLLKDGGLDETKLTPIAATWPPLYRDEVRKPMTDVHSPQEGPQRTGPSLPESEH